MKTNKFQKLSTDSQAIGYAMGVLVGLRETIKLSDRPVEAIDTAIEGLWGVCLEEYFADSPPESGDKE